MSYAVDDVSIFDDLNHEFRVHLDINSDDSAQWQLSCPLDELIIFSELITTPTTQVTVDFSSTEFEGSLYESEFVDITLPDDVITTGGVSVGEEDHIKPAIEQLGSLDMWKVKMKPGKPLAYGDIEGTPFIGLPGNPVSAFATFNLFARPYLLKMQGATNLKAKPIWLDADFEWLKAGFRREFARARLVNKNQRSVVEIYSNQGSGVLTSTAWADGFVVIPEDTQIHKGDKVAF